MPGLATAAVPTHFKVFIPLLKAERSVDGKIRLSGIASSNTTDLHGDRMTDNALAEMLAATDSMTMFLNHDYNVPEDVLGTVEKASLKRDGVRALLSFDAIRVDESNPRAVQTASSILDNGTKLGISIGANIPEGGATWDKSAKGYVIDHVKLLEASIVGIPANPHSWVEYAVKSLAGGFPDMLTRTADGPVVYMGGEASPEAVEIAKGDPSPAPHTHGHAHVHGHEHSHGYGSDASTHSHDHAHLHSHDHNADHEHADTFDDWSHSHPHDGGSSEDHAHEEKASGVEIVKSDESEVAPVPPVETAAPDAVEASEEPDATRTVTVKTPGGHKIVVDESAEEATEATKSADAPSQGADSTPDDEAMIERAMELLSPTIERAVKSSADLIGLLTNALSTAMDERDAARRERDDAITSAEAAVASATANLQKVLALPSGKRTTTAEVIRSALDSVRDVIPEGALKILEQNDRSARNAGGRTAGVPAQDR